MNNVACDFDVRVPAKCFFFFCDIRHIVHRKFVPQCETVNREVYCNVLKRLREDISRKRPDLWSVNNWILHGDHAPCHRALPTRVFLAKSNVLSIHQPSYSQDSAHVDFHLFSKLTMQLKSRCFNIVAEIQSESPKALDLIAVNDSEVGFIK